MSDAPANAAVTAPRLAAWDAGLEVFACDHCQWRYLVPTGLKPGLCPHCFRRPLAAMPDGLDEMPHPYPPELVIPFRLQEKDLEEQMRAFIRGIPFPPPDLQPAALRDAMQAMYLPIWLVDGQVEASWQAEAGYQYEVVSHQETYEQDRGGWKSREIKEQRMRWEPRLGKVNRAYQNLPATALEDGQRLEKSLGGFAREQAEPYHPGHLQRAIVRLPDVTPGDAWSEAAAAFHNAAAEECRQASQADQIRQFRWKARFQKTNWTLMLLPVFSACYLDDEGVPQPVLIHGQTGRVTGARKSSMRRARRFGLALLLMGIAALLTGLLLEQAAAASPALSAAAMFLIIMGIVSSAGMLVPIAMAWDFNRGHRQSG